MEEYVNKKEVLELIRRWWKTTVYVSREPVVVKAINELPTIKTGDSIHYEDIAFKAQIGRIHSFSEQDIVKPYLERLKRRMEARDDDNGGEPLNAVDRGYHWAYEHLCEEIDNLLSESD